MGPKAKQARHSLSLDDKVKLIEAVKAGGRHGAVGDKFGVSRQCVSYIMQHQEKILEKFHEGNSKSKKVRPPKFPAIDAALLKWFKFQRDRNVPIGGPIMLEKAEEIAIKLNCPEFKASVGWLDKFKKRYNITFRQVSGESRAVNLEDVSSWFTEKWPRLAERYSPRDIYNCDETGLFWRALPDKTHAFRAEVCSGGKHSKERLTVLLSCNMDGSDKMMPLVIGKSQKPRCFKRIRSIDALPVRYRANKTAWMTSSLFIEWLQEFDRRVRRQGRKVLLILDNCPSHPPNVSLQNVELQFLPPNTTSVCQPLDQGIIQNFKLKYRGLLLRKVIRQLDDGNANGWAIDVLDAIVMLNNAWNSVTSDCIANCFTKSGFRLPSLETSEIMIQENEELPMDVYSSLSGVHMSQDEYLSIDDDLCTSQLPSDEEILAMNNQQSSQEPVTQEEDDSEREDTISVNPSTVTLSQFYGAIETAKRFLMQQNKPLYEEINFLISLEEKGYQQSILHRKQSLLTDFYQKESN